MSELNTIIGSIFFIVLELSIFLTFFFFCSTPIKTKNLKRFTILTGFFVAYNVINQLNLVYSEELSLFTFLLFFSLLTVLVYSTYFVFSIIQNQTNKFKRKPIFYSATAPLILLFTSFLQPHLLLTKLIEHFSILFPVILSILVTGLFYFYKGLSKKYHSMMMLSSGILLAASFSTFFIREEYDKQLHLGIINLNYFLLAVFTLLIHRRSIVLTLYKDHKLITKVDANYVATFKEHGLTKRQIEIAQYIVDGKSYIEISEVCHLALNTVTKHASNIFNKFEVHDRESFINKLP